MAKSTGTAVKGEKLAGHIADTYPQTTADYMGKEHFWALADEVDLAQRCAGRLFTEVAFPIRGNPCLQVDPDEIVKIEPESVGLNIRRRIDVGMLLPPVNIAPNTVTPPAAIAVHHPDVRGKPSAIKRVVTETVVQMQGVIDLGCDPDQFGVTFTPRSLESLTILLPRLMEFPES